MNKKIVFGVSWIINVLLLLLIVLIPKSESSYQLLSLFTMALIFIVPFVLVFSQAYLNIVGGVELTGYKECENGKRQYNIGLVCPNIGCILIILLTFANFIKSIEKIAIAQMTTILMGFVLVELYIAFLLLITKKMTKKQYVWVNVLTYGALFMFFCCAVIMSVDYGII